MKSTMFCIEFKKGIKGEKYTEYTVELLKAYAIEYTHIDIGGVNFNESYYTVDNEHGKLSIENKAIENKAIEGYEGYQFYMYLYVYYDGIRDYKLLFPKIRNDNILIRLAHYYKESEKCLENGIWLSYVLMCGAIYEGILYYKYFLEREQIKLKYDLKAKNSEYKDKDICFQHLIKYAFFKKDISKETKKIMDDARDYRNLVHVNPKSESYVERINAMDTKKTMDNLIKNFEY